MNRRVCDDHTVSYEPTEADLAAEARRDARIRASQDPGLLYAKVREEDSRMQLPSFED